MGKENRDDFSPKTKQALAARANFRCSFTGCNQITCGPSHESSLAVNNTGVASHIYAAAPGGRRYRSDMTSEERSDITNGIWLCATHSVMIDRDEVTFTPEVLFQMKKEHELKIQREHSNLPGETDTKSELFRLGFQLIFTGELLSVEPTKWNIKLNEYISGNKFDILNVIDYFDNLTNEGKCIISESLSDARLLTSPPRMVFTSTGLILELKVSPRTKRISGSTLGSDLALDDTGDLLIENGDLKIISGIDRLSQHLMICLSTQKGEIYGQPNIGVNLSEYYTLFKRTTWLERILKLEVIYHSALGPENHLSVERQTTLECIDRVEDFYVVSDISDDDFFTVFIRVQVKDYGLWEGEVKVYLNKNAKLLSV
ncbi:TPA: hypothetical protein MO340_000267 [Salmonella enterica subsp. salamae serovar 35:g,m,s,t:-]|nr:hypothetical protein [Salmonella enterica subsp. salamae serovar 35:g,m,s,t:-]HCA3418885.1 hypothetical protein [Salmonella enterica subsp. salamae serovar 35:g,m,s,t:-]HCA3428052.1 hypothetical protein [Salmonella enterica subsp. salamae serovar 35:g,m,s,t:-]HCA3437689.1 hypothetical protein [Salmonella enterica subsp. salamae serovar 35:g,m,s,t:-]HCA3442195.1 hypothetical protein [Salmonella enterica subsp. salamae serovar 35:g,m,s,t:-]